MAANAAEWSTSTVIGTPSKTASPASLTVSAHSELQLTVPTPTGRP
jgi:hypothetical protein